MVRGAFMGIAAGAMGTVVLNIVTYADMALRGRAASQVPQDLAGKLADMVGLDLTQGAVPEMDTAEHRRMGVGALMGYVTGLGVGAVYGLVQPALKNVSLPVVGIGVGLAAMAASDLPAMATRVTDPATWRPIDWALDVGFHVAYGLTTVLAYEEFTNR